MAAIDQLITDLRADGSVDSEGKFTLDREQARAKMQKFQLVDARRYVLELVQSAVLRGASKLEFEIDADDMRLRFDGQAFTQAELDDLYGSLFGDGDSRALRGVRQLALALNAALGMEPKHIVLVSGNVELRMAPGKRDEIIVHDRAVAQTQIHVRQRLRMRVFVDFFLNLAGRIAEEQYLRQRCVFATVPVILDFKQLNAGLVVPEAGIARLSVGGPDYRGELMIIDREKPCELRLVKDGVWIENKSAPECGTHLIAVIEGDNLRKDVSQAKIVETAALERIVAALKGARWRLWMLAQQQAEGRGGERVTTLIRRQLLHHASRDELRDNADARALAERITWADSRDPERRVSLSALVELAAAEAAPRFCTASYPELEAEGDPIILLEHRSDALALEKLLGCELVEADDLLVLERRRVLGRRAWLSRAGKPELPTHVNIAARASISVDLDSGPVRGEIGLDALTLSDPSHDAPVHLFMFKDGCLLGRTELDLELPNLWMAIDAGFEPNVDYTDAKRDPTFIASLLRGLAALGGPITTLLGQISGVETEAHLRGLVKRWLIGLIDPPSQRAVLTRAGVDVSSKFFMPTAELLPGLAIDRLLGDSATDDSLAAAPLFEPLIGPRLSLAQLGQLIRANQKLRYVESRPDDPRMNVPEVVFLGPGDRKIVRALFGDRRLEKWDPAAKQRELEFWDSPRLELDGVRTELERTLATSGAVVSRRLLELSDGPTRGFVCFGLAGVEDGEVEALGGLDVRVRHEGRELCNISVEGLGPIIAVIEHPGLRPSASWDDVIRDAALDEALAAVRAGSRELARRACVDFERETGPARRWLARVLLHGAARDPELLELALPVPLLATVNGEHLTLAQARTLMNQHGRLEYVSRETGWAPVTDPPVIYADLSELDDLNHAVGGVYEDGAARVKHHRAFELLADRPSIRAKLDPERILVSTSLRGKDQFGEIGIPRARDELALALTLGLAGKEVGQLWDHAGFFVPVDAVVIDEELPLDGDGNVDSGNKRVRALVRQCRRRVSGLVRALCERWPELRGDERDRAWRVLVGYLGMEAGQERSKAREAAFEAAATVPGFRDVSGRSIGLAEVLSTARSRPLDVLSASAYEDPGELPSVGRLILIVERFEIECLQAHVELRSLDDNWKDELAAIEALATAPKITTPNIHEVALAYRKAAVAGGLEAELWLPRSPSLLESAPSLIFAVAQREVGRRQVSEALPTAGIVLGEGLVHLGGEVMLEPRQIASLERQQVILYADLARLVADERVGRADHDRALEYLAWAAHHLDAQPELLRAHGKHALALKRALDSVVPPALRQATARRFASAGEPPAAEARRSNAAPAQAEPQTMLAAQAEAPKPAAPPPPVAPPVPRAPATPEQRLLAAVYAQLHWARERHEVLDELLLNHLEVRAGGAGDIAALDRNALALNRDHPIVARLLGQDPHDPVDLTFLIAALYSLLNYEAEEITDDHERAFVAQLAETLAISARASRP